MADVIFKDIESELKVADNGLLSKIQIGGKTYELKDQIAREKLTTLRNAALQDVAESINGTGLVKASDVKAYVDSQVGSINKFDVVIGEAGAEGKPNVTASADTMYKLYLIPTTGASAGEYVEYITIRTGEEGAYTYAWEAIGSTKVNLTGYVTSEVLKEALKDYTKTQDLGALAFKSSASGTVYGQTISGVTATGTSTGSITVELQATDKDTSAAGKFTPAGNVSGTVHTAGSIEVTAKHEAADAVLTKGDYTPAGTVSANFDHAATAATLTKGDYTPEGTVAVSLSGAEFNVITSTGTAASFTEGEFTPASITKEDVTANYATEGLVGKVESECLTFTAAGIEAITATKVKGFDGGSKAKDTFVANTPATMAAQTVGVQSASFTGTKAAEALVTGVSYDKASLTNLAFAGTKAEGALVTGVSYQKADINTATFTGDTVDINATFAGTEGDVSVAGKCKDYSVKTAEFNGAAITLNVGDIVVEDKNVTVQ